MTNKDMVTLSQNMGRLNKGVVEWMFAEAENYLAEDDAQKDETEARNLLENFCHMSRTWRRAVLDNMSTDDKSFNKDASKNGTELQHIHKMRRSRRSRRRCLLPMSRASPSQLL